LTFRIYFALGNNANALTLLGVGLESTSGVGIETTSGVGI